MLSRHDSFALCLERSEIGFLSLASLMRRLGGVQFLQVHIFGGLGQEPQGTVVTPGADDVLPGRRKHDIESDAQTNLPQGF